VAIIDTLFTQTFKEVFEAMGSEAIEQSWTLGEPNKKKGESQVSAVEIRDMKTQVRSKKVNIRFSATKRNEDHDHWMSRKKGERTHAFLQLMLMHQNAEKAMEIFDQTYTIAEDEERILWRAVTENEDWMKLVLSPQDNAWRIEESLLLEGGKELRPDAYRVTKDCIELIDFKTGKEKAEHLSQIDDYSKVLFDIWKMPIKGMLYYTENQKWIHSTYHGQLL
jgi:hypothetical protein